MNAQERANEIHQGSLMTIEEYLKATEIIKNDPVFNTGKKNIATWPGTRVIVEHIQESEASLRGAVLALSKDMHQVSSRPCPTCRTLSKVLGEPFGCYAYQNSRGAK